MCKPAFLLPLLVLTACQRPLPHPDISGSLKDAMAKYLKKSVGKDSARIRFEVKEVSYFKDTTFYECEFKVRMILPDKDTTGEMTARISSDFSKVTRKW